MNIDSFYPVNSEEFITALNVELYDLNGKFIVIPNNSCKASKILQKEAILMGIYPKTLIYIQYLLRTITKPDTMGTCTLTGIINLDNADSFIIYNTLFLSLYKQEEINFTYPFRTIAYIDSVEDFSIREDPIKNILTTKHYLSMIKKHDTSFTTSNTENKKININFSDKIIGKTVLFREDMIFVETRPIETNCLLKTIFRKLQPVFSIIEQGKPITIEIPNTEVISTKLELVIDSLIEYISRYKSSINILLK